MNSEKNNKNKTYIRKLIVEGKEITSQLEILGHIKDFFIDKYARKIGVSSLDCSNYLHDIPNSSSEDAISCDGPISIQEITHVHVLRKIYGK